MADCRKATELFGAYVFGDLSPDEMQMVREHTEDCPSCAEDLKSRMQTVALIPSEVPALSDEDRQRIMWSVKGAVRAKEERARPRIFSPIFVGAMAAAVLLVVLGTGTIVGIRCRESKRPDLAKSPSVARQKPKPQDEVAKKPLPSVEKGPQNADSLALSPEPLDQKPETYRGPVKNKRSNRRNAAGANSSTAAANPESGKKVPVAPSADSPNNADLGKMGTPESSK